MPPHNPSQTPQDPPHRLGGATWRMMRETHKLPSRTAATMLGISHSHLLRIESGERSPGDDLYNRLTILYASLGHDDLLPPAKQPA